MEDLINFIKNNPSILKRPIIMDEHHFLVGYNEEEIRIFIPRSQRRKNSEF
jgi:regulatory protein spx